MLGILGTEVMLTEEEVHIWMEILRYANKIFKAAKPVGFVKKPCRCIATMTIPLDIVEIIEIKSDIGEAENMVAKWDPEFYKDKYNWRPPEVDVFFNDDFLGKPGLKLDNIIELVEAVSAGCFPTTRGPVVAEYVLWTGRIVRAIYYRGEKQPDVAFPDEIFVVTDTEKLQPFVEKLLEGESFIIRTGRGDEVCTLEWTLI
jgi:hypothetical protein